MNEGTYSDPKAPGNSSRYHTGKRCIEFGCGNPAGTYWSPHWCVQHNIKRTNRINGKFGKMIADGGPDNSHDFISEWQEEYDKKKIRNKGKKMFITIEGIEGAGKTTQIKHLSEFLDAFDSLEYDHIITREPGGTKLGKVVRDILFDPIKFGTTPTAELLLYMVDRAQHLQKIVRPALTSNKIVISDRYYDATIAYQSAAKGINENLIKKLHVLTCENLQPDLTFLLDLSPAEALSRVKIRKNKKTRFYSETEAFHEKVRSGYLKLAWCNPKRIVIIDASAPEEIVKNKIAKELLMRLETAK